MSAVIAAIFAIVSVSAFSQQTIRFTGLYQKDPGGKVWLKVKTRTIDPKAFRHKQLKMFTGGGMKVVKVLGTPYCTSNKTAVFKLKEKGKRPYKTVVHFARGHVCVRP